MMMISCSDDKLEEITGIGMISFLSRQCQTREEWKSENEIKREGEIEGGGSRGNQGGGEFQLSGTLSVNDVLFEVCV